MPMSNPLYFQWLDALAKRDQAMLFITLTAAAAIGGWLVIREHRRARQVFIYMALAGFWFSLAVVGLAG